MKIISVKFDSECSECIFCEVTYSKVVWFKNKEFTEMFYLSKYTCSFSCFPRKCSTGKQVSDVYETLANQMIHAYEKSRI